ncbi:uncharacterized protein LOC125580339 [Brassica napus]|uniref:uncharacterized protein LOC106418036 n=1 Tax=Brassica napus TaxID=3708 RepID=UPI002078D954|nr:uncharacterized protein LOC106418036 [Brassica napus]XP_048600648.1 uncharacterized protein LOC106418036 [Brassica napus]XP_048600649.1 uncharacterized protein LOC125580339 [Brassica napus]XP_048600650.1 uncharacterized protein LOC125580339 [Brassica napus]
MNEPDKVLFVHGTWVRDADNRWIFEPDIVCAAEHLIELKMEMTMTELVAAVKECLDITSKDISVKLSFQYPEWVAMGDGGLDTPQYITDDTDVGVFIRMRSAIEEVDLYVSIVRHSPGGKEDNLPRQLSRNMRKGGEDGGANCVDEEDWHAFALSETPLTLPPTQKDVGGKDQEVPECSERQRRNSTTSRTTIPHGQRGIVIREPGEIVRLSAPETEARQKGKKKRPLEYETDSNTDSDDAMVVPVLRASIPEKANAARPVARRLVFRIPGIPTTQKGAGSSSSSTEALPEVADEFGQHWGKFDEALHEMLSDPYTPALFGKDAPPVFNSRRGTGITHTM